MVLVPPSTALMSTDVEEASGSVYSYNSTQNIITSINYGKAFENASRVCSREPWFFLPVNGF